ncbi:hypothetical protein TNCV_4912471 [Trichonephila clavipes]|nr:hypothetical protein TNCV_4912471 [Trichonephila clavipes]
MLEQISIFFCSWALVCKICSHAERGGGLVFVWASRLSQIPWVRFDYPFPFVIRSKNRGELQCLLKQLLVSENLTRLPDLVVCMFVVTGWRCDDSALLIGSGMVSGKSLNTNAGFYSIK